MASFRYCFDCNNLLYPKENKETQTLMFACRNCQYEERAENNCVYRHEIVHAPSEKTMMLTDLRTDPTLPRKIMDTRCGHSEAVYFQSSSRRADAKMKLFYVCTECSYRWTDETPDEDNERSNLDESS